MRPIHGYDRADQDLRLKKVKSMANDLLVPDIPAVYLERLRKMLGQSRRTILGLVGCPGSGKSFVAKRLHEAFPDVSQIVPMDGYHLANAELKRLGRAGRKGAPDTFDSAGYASLLTRLRSQPADEIVYAPEFHREIEEGVAGSVPIFPDSSLIITEGNYLLLDDGHWGKVANLLDEVWYVDVDDVLRIQRLTRRHEQFGRTLEAAIAWVENTDEPNARLIATHKSRAQIMFRWES